MPEPVLNKRTVESLIKAGAFDRLGHPRRGLLAAFEQIIDVTLERRRERDQGVMSLFGDWDEAARRRRPSGLRRAQPDPRHRVRQGRPAARPRRRCSACTCPTTRCSASRRRSSARSSSSIADLDDLDDGAQVVVGGVITGLARKFTKRGDQMAVFVLEDLEATIEVTVFPRTLQEQGHKLEDDMIVAVKGRLDKRDESRFGLIAQDIQVLAGLERRPGAVAAAGACPATPSTSCGSSG